MRSQRKKPGRDLILLAVLWTVVRQQVSSDLFLHEPVVGLVVVECPDHIVAIAPRHRKWQITGSPNGIGVADDIQPVPPPALAETIRLQQPLHNCGVCPVTLVGHECFHLGYRWRQAGEIVGDAPEQVRLACIRDWPQALIL